MLLYFFFLKTTAPAVVKDSSREQCYLTHRAEHACQCGATSMLTRHLGGDGCREVRCGESWLTWTYTEAGNNPNHAGHADVAQDRQLHLWHKKSGESPSYSSHP